MAATKPETLRLLVLHESQDHAEQIVNALKNTGLPTRPVQVDNQEEFLGQLREGSWDILLCAEAVDDLTFDAVIGHVRKMDKDIPVVVLLEAYDPEMVTDTMSNGAVDSAVVDNYSHIALIVRRELNNLRARRARRRLETALHEAEGRNKLLLDNSRDAVAYIHEGMHIYANAAYVELFGYETAEELEGMPVVDLVAKADLDSFKNYLKSYSKGEAISEDLRFRGLTSGGAHINAMMNLSAASYEGESCTQLIIRIDTGEAVAAELAEKLREAASTDQLTGLGNRSSFETRLGTAIADARKAKTRFGLFYITLDNFSSISANYGISGADSVIEDTARLLQTELGAHTLSRFADYTFTALVEGVDADSAQQQAEKLCQQIHDHMVQLPDGRTIQVSASIGVALIGESSANADEMLSRAAAEKGRASDKGGNRVSVYNPAANASSSDSALLELLNNALEKGSFKLMFQPLIDVRGEGGEFYEVYLRLPLADGKLMDPDEFLPVAMANQIGAKIDRWVMLQSAKLLKEHVKNSPNSKILINLCAESLLDTTLPAWIGKLAKAVSPSGHPIVLQFKEQDVVNYLKQAKELTQALSDQGCEVSICHFGCSLNPMNTLKHVTATYVKLEGSFTQDLNNEENLNAMKKIVGELNAIDKVIVVPFVETAATLSKLWTVGVHYLQGYYLQAPTEQMVYENQ